MITTKGFDKIVNKRTADFEAAIDDWLESISNHYKSGERTFKLPNLNISDCLDSLSERGFNVSYIEGSDWVVISIPPYKV